MKPNRLRAERLLTEMGSLMDPSFDEQVQRRINEIRASAADGCSLDEAPALLSAATLAGVLAAGRKPTLNDPNTGKRTLVTQRVPLIQAQRAAVLDALVAGELVAIGWDDRQPLDAPPITLPGSRWRSLTPDWDANVARASTAVVSDIRVYRKESGTVLKPGRSLRVNETELKRLLNEEADKHIADRGTPPTVEQLQKLVTSRLGRSIPRAQWRCCLRMLESSKKRARGEHAKRMRSISTP